MGRQVTLRPQPHPDLSALPPTRERLGQMNRLRQSLPRRALMHTYRRFQQILLRSVLMLIRPLMVRLYLMSHASRRLHLGAGHVFLPGWLNTDVEPWTRRYFSREATLLDVTRHFPFRDMTFDYIVGEHMIEHVTYHQGLSMLRECFRTLRPGGKIRLATPDLAVIIGLYTRDDEEPEARYIKWNVDVHLADVGIYTAPFVINNEFRNWAHQFLYDEPTLCRALRTAGFKHIVRCPPWESDDDALRGIESRAKHTGEEQFVDSFVTMIVEATR